MKGVYGRPEIGSGGIYTNEFTVKEAGEVHFDLQVRDRKGRHKR